MNCSWKHLKLDCKDIGIKLYDLVEFIVWNFLKQWSDVFSHKCTCPTFVPVRRRYWSDVCTGTIISMLLCPTYPFHAPLSYISFTCSSLLHILSMFLYPKYPLHTPLSYLSFPCSSLLHILSMLLSPTFLFMFLYP